MRNRKRLLLVAFPLIVSPCCAHTLAVPTDSLRRAAREAAALGEVVVRGNTNKQAQLLSALNSVRANKQFIEQRFSGSLMQTLSLLPGVKAMSIGSGESKPMIRGLGFNRVLVAENGVKHEGQQWGDDHGLEVDQFAVDQADVIKGPAALSYGSDAIAGVINLKCDVVPWSKCSASVNLFGRTVNQSVGTSLQVAGRSGRMLYKANATWTDYADYRVPTDHIAYYSYNIPLYKYRLRNTAGREWNGSVLLGYDSPRLKTVFRLSDVNTRSGFFANAHGLEVRLSTIDYDRSSRDIDLPFHRVNHFMLTNQTDYRWQGGVMTAHIAYQDNRQCEESEPVSHGYMPVPPNTIERIFAKRTYSANVKVSQMLDAHELQVGMSVERQHNQRGGWSFIIPNFEQTLVGAFVLDKWQVKERLQLSAGVRYDRGRVQTHHYYDWYLTPITATAADSAYMQRSSDLMRSFNSITWSVGSVWQCGTAWVLKANVGKSFRMPIAKELAADGVNYSIFRYEQGNTELNPEESYQVDAGIAYEPHGSFSVTFTPYVNYFPNYIYLNPTAVYREGLQLYHYTQARVLRWGFEASAVWYPIPSLSLQADGEYLYARQLNGEKRGYSLPYSTPWSVRTEARWQLPKAVMGRSAFLTVEWQVVGKQSRVVPPEEPTSGHQLFNASLNKQFVWGKKLLSITLRAENLLNKRYYDHTSYYRLIGVPEPGRNFSLMLKWQI